MTRKEAPPASSVTRRAGPAPAAGGGTVARSFEALDRPRVALALLAFSALVFSWQCFTAASRWSMTSDEVFHVPAGYVYWRLGDFTFNAEHPPLAKLLATLPLLVSRPALPSLSGYAGLSGHEFCFEANETRAILVPPRLVIAGLGLLLGLAVYLWGSRLLCPRVGLLAAFLCFLEPNLTAHSSLVTTDVPLTLFFLLAVMALWELTRRITLPRFAAFALAAAAAATTKFSAVLLTPCIAALATLAVLRRGEISWSPGSWRLGRRWAPPVLRSHTEKAVALGALLLAALLVCYAAIWAVYGFSFRGPDRADIVHARTVPGILEAWRKLGSTVSPEPYRFVDEHRLLPHAYVAGLLGVALHNARGHGAFLLGEGSNEGRPEYFPLAILFKTPLPLLVLLGLGAVLLVRTRALAAGEVAFLAVPPAIYLAASMAGNLNIGVRHVLPLYPFMAIVAASVLSSLPRLKPQTRRRLATAVVALAAWHAFEGVRYRPHFLSYFNQLAGGPADGYRVLSDSNVDWGQDLYLLKRWTEANDARGLKVAYFGPAVPDIDAGIACEYVMAPALKPNVANRARLRDGDLFAVSATFLAGMGGVTPWDAFKFLERYRPVARIGYSIFVYRITDDYLIDR